MPESVAALSSGQWVLYWTYPFHTEKTVPLSHPHSSQYFLRANWSKFHYVVSGKQTEVIILVLWTSFITFKTSITYFLSVKCIWINNYMTPILVWNIFAPVTFYMCAHVCIFICITFITYVSLKEVIDIQ